MTSSFPRFQPSRSLGRTGFVATALGIGDVADRALPIEQCVATARRAIDAGLNLIDTAPNYEDGYSEQIVGTVCFKTFGAGKLLGDTSGYQRPLAQRPRGKISSGGAETPDAVLPRLTVEECLHHTLSVGPDVALLGMSFPNEQDAAFAAARSFERPLSNEQLADIRRRAATAIAEKGPCWWNPTPTAPVSA